MRPFVSYFGISRLPSVVLCTHLVVDAVAHDLGLAVLGNSAVAVCPIIWFLDVDVVHQITHHAFQALIVQLLHLGDIVVGGGGN